MKKLKQIILLTLTILLVSATQTKAATYGCGDTVQSLTGNTCSCQGITTWKTIQISTSTPAHYCCGEIYNDYSCVYPGYTPSPSPTGTTTPNPTSLPAPDAATLDSLNPLKLAGGDETLSTPGGFISKAVNIFVFPIAGIILFLMLVFGGFQMLMGAANSKSLEEGKQRVTSAIIGFIILFASYWIVQLIELIFGFSILG
jgi:hypothetical protein